jgi:hypothetical protein
MQTAIRLCGGLAVVGFGLYAAVTAVPTGPTSFADCGAGYCFTAADLVVALFAAVGGASAALTGLLVLIAAAQRRQGVVGLALALLIFTNFAAALVYVATGTFQAVLFEAPGAYFAPNSQLPWYFGAASTTFSAMLALAPLPSLLSPPGPPRPRAPVAPLVPLASLILAGVSLVALDRVADHYAAVGVGPAWPLLASAVAYYVFWLVAWLLLMGTALPSRTQNQ